MKIAFLGDVALLGQFDITKNENVAESIKYLKKVLEKYDYVVANLESPLTNRKKTLVCKSMHLRSAIPNVRVLKELGIRAVSLANNHMYDYGRKGLKDTISTLEQAGIDWYGVDGKDLEICIKEEKIIFSGFCCYSTNGEGYRKKQGKGINLLNADDVFEQLQRDESKKAFSVLSIHWGIEHTNYPAREHMNLANKLACRKSLLLHGHHPHVIQGITDIGNSTIAYSLGNALFDEAESITGNFKLGLNEENRRSFVLGLNIEKGKIINRVIHGFYISEHGIQAYDIEKELTAISEKLTCIDDIEVYEQMRQKQYQTVIGEKFGKRDFKWLVNRLNYYSIVAKFMAILRKKNYRAEVEKFLEE